MKTTPKGSLRKREYQKRYNEQHKERLKEYQREYHVRNKLVRNEKTRAYNKRRRAYEPNVYMWSRFKSKAKRLGIPFNLEPSDILIPTHCPILGLELKFNLGVGKALGNSPSLDKINPELGYVKGNVWVISTRANLMKQDASSEELRKFGEWALNQ